VLTCSIGIMAYNEGSNIGRMLDALIKQELAACTIKEICVVASGCTDNTEAIVREFMATEKRIKLFIQEKREGKAAAINVFLSKANADVFVLAGGDTILGPQALDRLVCPFMDTQIGMTGGHPIPVNSDSTFAGFTVRLLWSLHHRISLEHPKMGELVAFRNIVKKIPADTAVDEASIEVLITRAGLKLKYVGDALVYNKGPETVRELLNQRRRIAAGHLSVRVKQGHSVSTTSLRNVFKALAAEMQWKPKAIARTAGAVLIEGTAKILGYYDHYVRKRNPYVWDVIPSTKKIAGDLK
jgi:biofilm PGA synthesis N-glycosyltransferase PgaC